MAELTSPNQEQRSAQEEIRELERLLNEKKQALVEKGESAPDAKEAFKEVFHEKYAEFPPANQPAQQSPAVVPAKPLSDDMVKQGEELKKKRREEQLAALIDISFERGVVEAVNLARAMTPWLLDELHDKLVDEYYDKLVEAQLVKPL